MPSVNDRPDADQRRREVAERRRRDAADTMRTMTESEVLEVKRRRDDLEKARKRAVLDRGHAAEAVITANEIARIRTELAAEMDEARADDAAEAEAARYVAMFGERFDGPPVPFRAPNPIPEFPVDALPQVVAEMVSAVAEDTQTDPAMAGAVALGVLAAVAAGFADIEVRRGWREPMTLFMIPVAGPGERKSAVLSAFSSPLRAAERDLNQARDGDRVRAETEKGIAEAAASKAATIAAQDRTNTVALTEAEAAATAAAAIEVPAALRLLADDTTPEAAASLMVEQGGRLAILSAEGGFFDTLSGRYSRGVPNIDFALKGHAADPLRVDRRGRSESIERAYLAMLLMVQPDVIDSLSGNRAFRGRGLIARMLFALPVSRVGRRSIDSAPVPEHVQGRYDRRIKDLVTALATRDCSGGPLVLTLDDDAAAVFRAVRMEVEGALGEGDLDSIQDWGSKYPGAVARTAGLLHLAEHGPAGQHLPVGADAMNGAIMIGEYFRACAGEVLGGMGEDPARADAEYALRTAESLYAEGAHPFTRRELQRKGRRLKTAAQASAAITLLAEHGYVAVVGGQGASLEYALNPRRPRGQKGQKGQTPGVAA